ncbi:unnamed protein product, partial [Allacma fusca]
PVNYSFLPIHASTESFQDVWGSLQLCLPTFLIIHRKVFEEPGTIHYRNCFDDGTP